MTIDLKTLIPARISEVPAWKDYIETVDSEIFDEYVDLVQKLLDLRDPDEAEAFYLSRFQKLLGLNIDTSPLDVDESRRLIATLTRFWETSGTGNYINFLKFARNMDITITELYTTERITSVLATGNGVKTSWIASELATPGTLIANFVTISDSVETFTDDGAGVLTGDQGGSGTVNYTNGEVTLTFNTAPGNGVNINLQNSKTHDYQSLVATPGGTLTINGGDWYLTNFVDILYDLVKFPQGASQVLDTFYQIAPLVLIVNNITAELIDEIVEAAVVMAGVAENGLEGLISATV